MRPEVVADENFRAEKQRTHMQVIASNPALGARALQDLNRYEIAGQVGFSQMHVSRLQRRALARMHAQLVEP